MVARYTCDGTAKKQFNQCNLLTKKTTRTHEYFHADLTNLTKMTAQQEVLAVAIRMKTLGGKPAARAKRLAYVRFVRSV